MNSFRVGMKVVCIDNHEWDHKLALGAVYEVSAVGWELGEIYIGLVETPASGGGLLHWRAYRFRPVVEPGTEKGMSILRELLNTQDQPVRADA
ncbi:hypothetical protein [Shinella zoogloeoides]|uniref:hypothetical protein n=1 Tax=Shinella zoogloeoides TaxID=352475 RepID=UPI00299E189C|nr:hypothetical protein [Shinella zoogloeoides]WPE22463.1 hypothetical protein ShzoTeo12_36790 [Shinella zoogloeoides]